MFTISKDVYRKIMRLIRITSGLSPRVRTQDDHFSQFR